VVAIFMPVLARKRKACHYSAIFGHSGTNCSGFPEGLIGQSMFCVDRNVALIIEIVFPAKYWPGHTRHKFNISNSFDELGVWNDSK
jgi:hypothetical protein